MNEVNEVNEVNRAKQIIITDQKMAWELSRLGKVIPYSVGDLSKEELKELKDNPVKTSYLEYMHLRGQNIKTLQQRAYGLEEFVDNIDKQSLFYFLTRGYLPKYPKIREYVDRYREFKRYHPVIKELFEIVYGSAKNYYINQERSPIEGPLRLYNFNMGQPGAEYILATELNVNFINSDKNNHVSILNHLKDILTDEKDGSQTKNEL
jgi:hypothetical protein